MRSFVRARRGVLVVVGALVVVVSLAGFWWPTVRFARGYALSWLTSYGGERALERAEQRLAAIGAAKVPLADARIVVRKGERRLELFDGDRLVRSYPVVLGGKPEGRKEREGDRRTPEGTYRVCTRVNPSRYHLFLGLSYPNAGDAARGAEVLSEEEKKAIEQADASGGKPPWNTALGGAVGIHGGGTHADWTHGCIALENGDVEEIYAAVREGTEVVILP